MNSSIIRFVSSGWRFLPSAVRSFVTRLTQTKFTASVAAVVTNEKGELLLLDHVIRPGSGWGLPGGFMEPAEQPEKAIRREIREETGLELTNITFYRVRTLKRHIEVLFRAETTGPGEIKSMEIKQVKWFAPADIPKEMNLDQQFLIQKIFQTDV